MRYTIDNTTNNIIINDVTRDELDLDKTLNCGQAFRWNKDSKNNWIGVVDKEIWILRQYENYIVTNIKSNNKEKLIYYFNLDMNYTDEISKLDLDDYAKRAYECGKGIHILRQNLFETMVTFLMSQFNSMHNIRLIVEKLSTRYGDKLIENWSDDEIVRYTFPTLEQLSKCSYDDFMNCSIGLRTNYLISMINYLNGNYNILNYLKNCNYNNAIFALKKFDGIGDKVANCIALFSLHHVEAFPIDVHIKRIINEEYSGSIDISRYGQYAGIIQQYMYYYRAFK
jgi:N-glycosylase/DNA lyase